MTAKPAICFVSMEVYPNLRPGVAEEAGGAGFQLVQLARGLRDRGYRVSFVVGDYGQEFHEKIDGFDVYRSNQVAYDRSIGRGVVNMARLWRAMKEARADHYILRSTRFLSFFVMLYARLLDARYTFMVATLPNCLKSGLESLAQPFRAMYELSLKWAHCVTVQSHDQQELMAENFGIRCPIVSNGIDTPPYAGPHYDAPFDFSWVASFKIAKRADVLHSLAVLLPHRKFLVVGGPGPNLDYSQGLIDQLEACPNVTFEGFVPPDQVGQVYERARVFLNTSDWEGFPNGFLYAWTRGVPVGSLHIDPDGAVEKGRLGLVDPDIDHLAARLDQLLNDPEEYGAMSRRCYDHVNAHHSREKSVDELLAALPK